jgi:hypothetical protein
MAFAHPFFLLVCLLLSCSVAFASSAFNQSVRKAYAETIKLRIAQGRSLLQKELEANPTNAAAILVANQQDFLTLCVQQDPKAYASLLSAQEQRLQLLSSIKERNAWVDYSQAEVRLHIALSKLLFDHKLAAAWDLRQAYLQYVANAKRFPSFVPNRKTLGTLQVLIGSVPDNYRVFLNITGMKGDIKTGMANLKSAATLQNPFQQEAIVLQALLEHLLDQDKSGKAALTVSRLAESEPDNLLFSFVAMHLLKKNKQSEQALQVYRQQPAGPDYVAFPYLHHMAADLYLYKGDFTNSIRENTLFLQQHKGEHYLKAAHFKLYLAYWLNKQDEKASQHYQQIDQVGKAVVEEDSYAERFAEQAPNRHLMLSRLQSDGGYYAGALAALHQMKLQSHTPQADKAEYYYRKARIYHGMEKPLQAKPYYEKAISACENTTLYFAPHASLQLGYIYQEEKQAEKARAYFKKAMSYKGHTYKNSIDAKAKLALQTI